MHAVVEATESLRLTQNHLHAVQRTYVGLTVTTPRL